MYYIYDRKWIYQAKVDSTILTSDTLTSDVDTATDLLDLSFLVKKEELEQALEKIQEGYYILSEDSFFTITQLKITHNKDFSIFNIISEGIGGYDLLNQSLEPLAKPQEAKNIEYYINSTIFDTGFEIGLNESSDTKQLEFVEYQTPKQRLLAVLSSFGMEMKFRFEIKNNRIRHKYIDIVKNVGVDTQKNYYVGKEIETISVTRLAQNIVTALRAAGGTVEGQEKPLTLKGYKLTDAQKENGRFELRDDKILDVDSNKKWSRYLIPDETLRFEEGYIVGKFEGSQTTQSALADATIKALKTRSKATENYEVEFALQIDVNLGDRINCVHEASKLYISSRVLKIEKDNLNKKMTLTLGEEKIVKSNLSQEVIALSARLQEKYGAIAETKATIIKSLTPPSETNNIIWVDISSKKEYQEVKIYDNDKQSWVNISQDFNVNVVFEDDRFLNFEEINNEIKKSVEELGKDVQAIQNDVSSAEETLNEYKNFKDGITKTVNEQDNKIETVIKSSDDNTKNINALTQTSDSLTSTIGKLESDTVTKISQLEQTTDSIKLTVANKADSKDVASQIEQTASSITQTVSEKYPTKDQVASQISQKADSITQTVAEKYPTKDQVASQITQKADSITQTVASQYQPKGDYATTGYVASQIKQTSDSITSTISTNMSNTYSTKSETQSKVNAVQANVDKLGTNIAYAWSPDGTDRFTRVKSGENIILNGLEGLSITSIKTTVTDFYGVFKINPSYQKMSNWTGNNTTFTLGFSWKSSTSLPSNASIGLFFGAAPWIWAFSAENGVSGTSGSISKTGVNAGDLYNSTQTGMTVRLTNIPVGTVITITNLFVIAGTNQVFRPSPLIDYDNAVPRYIGRSLKDSTNPADFTWEPNPERKPWTTYAQGLNGEGLSLVPYGENLALLSDMNNSFTSKGITATLDRTSSIWKVSGTTNAVGDLWGFRPGSKDYNGPGEYIYSLEILSGTFPVGICLQASVYKDGAWSANYKSESGNPIMRMVHSSANFRDLGMYSLVAGTAVNFTARVKLELANTMGIPTPWTPAPTEDPLGAIPKYVGTAALPYEDWTKYTWDLNPAWLKVNTETIVSNQYSQSVQDLNGFKNTVGATYQTKDAMSGYYNKNQVDSAIVQKAGEITSTVSSVYETKTNVATNLNTAKSYADTQANNAKNTAVSTASSDATTKANNAKTAAITESKTYTDAQLKITSDSITSTVQSTVSGSNLISNGGFEDGDLFWNLSSISVIHDDPHTGKKSLKLNAANDVKTVTYKNTPYVESGRTYRITAWVQTNSTANGTADNNKLRIGDQNGSLLTALGFSGATAWKKMQTDYTVPDGVTRFTISISSNHTTGVVVWDDLSIVDITDLKESLSQIQQTADSITSTVSATYTKQSDFNLMKNQYNWTEVTSATNLNDFSVNGNYFMKGALTNSPITAWAYLRNDYINSSRVTQTIWKDVNSDDIYTRQKVDSTWSAWQRTATAADLGNYYTKTQTESQIEQTASQIRATVNTKVTNESYDTANTGGSNANKWTRFLRTTITNQYADVQVSLDMIGQGTGDSQTRNASLYVRHKQQDSLGSATSVTMDLVNSTFLVNTDIKAVVTTNSSSAVIVDYYVYINTSYTGLKITPITKSGGGTIEYISNTSFGGLPSGSQTFTAQYNGSLGSARDALSKYADLKITTDGISTEVGKKVGKSEVISTINQTPESVTINASKINLQGALTISQFSTSDKDKINNGISTANTANNQVNSWKKTGTTKIDGGNIYADSLSAISANLGTMKAGSIVGVDITSVSDNKYIYLKDGALSAYDSSIKSTTYLSPAGLINNNSANMKFYLDFTAQGMSIRSDNNNTGLARNTGIDLYGDNTYIDFHSASTNSQDSPARLWMNSNSDLELALNTGRAMKFINNFESSNYPGNIFFYTNEIHVKNNQNSNNYSRIFASSFSQQSTHSSKQDFENISTKDLLNAVNQTDIVKYHFIDEVRNGKPDDYVGFVINDDGKSPYQTSELLINHDGTGFNTTTAVGVMMGAIKELSKQNKELQAKVDTLYSFIESIDLNKITK